MIQCGFESGLGLDLAGFSIWHTLKLLVGDLSTGAPVSSLPHWLMVSAKEIMLN